MKVLKTLIGVEILVAVATWLMVASTGLYFSVQYEGISQNALAGAALAYLVFVVGFVIGTRDGQFRRDLLVRALSLFVQLISVAVIFYLIPYAYNAILITMWSGQVVYFIPLRRAILLSPLWSSLLWLFQTYQWEQRSAWLTAILFWMFNLFSMMMVDSRRKEEAARLQAEEANRALRAAQALLQKAAQDQERTRIARNIHDLLGHHLTALSIHLQVAQRQAASDSVATAQPELAGNINQCHRIARLLLQDVRDAVSDMREQGDISLADAIDALSNDLPSLRVNTDISSQLPELSIEQASALIYVVQESLTNALKHGKASRLDIVVYPQNGELKLTLQDNGEVSADFKKGNGLRGIEERIAQCHGSVSFERNKGFLTHIRIPLPQ